MDGGTLTVERKQLPEEIQTAGMLEIVLVKIAKIEQNGKKQSVCSYELTANYEKNIDKKG